MLYSFQELAYFHLNSTIHKTTTAPTLRAMRNSDWPSVARIYAEGISTGQATFETSVPEWDNWDNGHLTNCRIVAEQEDEICAWAALTPVSGRCVYAGVAEVSVYVSEKHRGKGLGHILLQTLVEESEANNIWTLQSGIFSENVASIKLHLKSGFRQVGYRERIGKMNGAWRDTVLLERRSSKVGI